MVTTVTSQSIEALLAPEFSAGLELRSDDDLRTMKQECTDVETTVSYYRRLAQGRIEILGAWRQRRREGGSVEDLVADLPRILAGSGSRSSAATSRLAAAAGPIGDLEWEGGRHHLVGDDTLAELPTLDDEALAEHLDDLRGFEAELSRVRHRLHDVIDAVEGEIARRAAARSSSAP